MRLFTIYIGQWQVDCNCVYLNRLLHAHKKVKMQSNFQKKFSQSPKLTTINHIHY